MTPADIILIALNLLTILILSWIFVRNMAADRCDDDPMLDENTDNAPTSFKEARKIKQLLLKMRLAGDPGREKKRPGQGSDIERH